MNELLRFGKRNYKLDLFVTCLATTCRTTCALDGSSRHLMGTLNNPVCEEERNVLSAKKKNCLFTSFSGAGYAILIHILSSALLKFHAGPDCFTTVLTQQSYAVFCSLV